jgi:signal transduction histidine kinase
MQHTPKKHGLGIGTWLVKTYVELLGGKVLVDTKIKVGSTFTIALPALTSTAESSAP